MPSTTRSTNRAISWHMLLLLTAILLTTNLGGDSIHPVVEAKRSKCSNKLKKGDQDFFYCSKFAVAQYTQFYAYYDAKFQQNLVRKGARNDPTKKEAQIVLAAFNHQQWQRVLAVEGDDKEACKQKLNQSNGKVTIDVPLNGTTTSGKISHTSVHKAGPQMYYVAVMDCDGESHALLGDDYGKIEVKTHMHDENENEFSYEKQGIISIDVFLMLVYIVVFALNYQSWSVFQRRHDMWNTPHIYCIGAMVFQLVSIIIDLQSNILFSRSGDESLVLDIFSQIFAMINECTMILLLLMMANGWMTRWTRYDFDDGLEVYAPLFMLVLMVHICFAALSFIDKDAYHKYHDFQGWAGFGLIIAKFVLVGIYFYFYSQTKPKLQKSALKFYEQINMIGLIYLLSDPFLLLGTYILSEWNMAFYYNIADQLMHLGIQCYFLYQLHDGKSALNKNVDNFSTLPSDLKNK